MVHHHISRYTLGFMDVPHDNILIFTLVGDSNGASVSFRLSKRRPMPWKDFLEGLKRLSGLVRRRSFLRSLTINVTPLGNVVWNLKSASREIFGKKRCGLLFYAPFVLKVLFINCAQVNGEKVNWNFQRQFDGKRFEIFLINLLDICIGKYKRSHVCNWLNIHE